MGNFEADYDKTQFFPSNHNAFVGQWDTRAEFGLPPFYSHTNLTWGPYIRFSGTVASQTPDWENGLLAGPGVGFQIYPFSFARFHENDNVLGKYLGPLRLYAEYNRMGYWGTENRWRPDEQKRFGAEYWRAWNVNNLHKWWWAELWSGVWWQSANDYDPHYDSTYFADSLRAGVRAPHAGFWSGFTPYAVINSSLDSHPGSYWENYLQLGAGIRYAPPLSTDRDEVGNYPKLSRIVFFVEYVNNVTYYRAAAPSDIPRYDIQAGVTFNLGDWFWNRWKRGNLIKIGSKHENERPVQIDDSSPS